MAEEPWTLTEQLEQLAREDPNVAAAAEAFDETVRRINSGRLDAAHGLPCTDETCWWHNPITAAYRPPVRYYKPVVCVPCERAQQTACGRLCVRPCVCTHGKED